MHRHLRHWLPVVHRSERALALAFVLSLTGCGGQAERNGVGPSDAGTSADATGALMLCAPFKSCGGNLLGSWTVVSNCYDSAVSAAGCESIYHTTEKSAGTYEFSDAGTFVSDLSGTVSFTLVVPPTCATSSCSALQTTIQGQFTKDISGSVICTSANAGECRCDVVSSSSASVSGRYAAVGSTLTFLLDQSNGATGVDNYCVQGNQLTLHEPGIGSLVLSRN